MPDKTKPHDFELEWTYQGRQYNDSVRVFYLERHLSALKEGSLHAAIRAALAENGCVRTAETDESTQNGIHVTASRILSDGSRETRGLNVVLPDWERTGPSSVCDAEPRFESRPVGSPKVDHEDDRWQYRLVWKDHKDETYSRMILVEPPISDNPDDVENFISALKGRGHAEIQASGCEINYSDYDDNVVVEVKAERVITRPMEYADFAHKEILISCTLSALPMDNSRYHELRHELMAKVPTSLEDYMNDKYDQYWSKTGSYRATLRFLRDLVEDLDQLERKYHSHMNIA